jgi:hypothetical protein
VSDDDLAKAVSVLLLASYFGVAVWRRAWLAPLNLLVSAAVTVFWALHVPELQGSVAAVKIFAAIEVVILITSALAVLGRRMPSAVLWAGFAVHVAVTALFALFMFTFHIDRMM